MSIKTVGFFGDSFVSDYTVEGTTTWLQQVTQHCGAECTALGHGGSSVWDLYLRQFLPRFQQRTLPTVCVMVWTEAHRLYHPTQRNMTYSTVEQNRNRSALWRAADMYYTHLLDDHKALWEYRMLLDYFDRRIAPLCVNTKFVHMLSFGHTDQWSDTQFRFNRVQYLHNWQTGVEIRPSLMCAALQRADSLQHTEKFPGHLVDQHSHDTVARSVIEAIDQYVPSAKFSMHTE